MMANTYTAIVEEDDGWFVAWCPEVPGANGQGRTKAEVLENLTDAIELILFDRLAEALNDLPANAERVSVNVA